MLGLVITETNKQVTTNDEKNGDKQHSIILTGKNGLHKNVQGSTRYSATH